MYCKSVEQTESGIKVGDIVTAVSFTDCFGKHHEERNGLVVRSISYVDGYYRIKAHKIQNEFEYVEGSEKLYFAKVA